MCPTRSKLLLRHAPQQSPPPAGRNHPQFPCRRESYPASLPNVRRQKACPCVPFPSSLRPQSKEFHARGKSRKSVERTLQEAQPRPKSLPRSARKEIPPHFPIRRAPASALARPRTPHCIPDNEARKGSDNNSRAECAPTPPAWARTARVVAHFRKLTRPRACFRDNSASAKLRGIVSSVRARSNIGALA